MIDVELTALGFAPDSCAARFYRRARRAGFDAAAALAQVAQMRAVYAANYLVWTE